MSTSATVPEIDSSKTGLKATWLPENYDLFLRYMEDGTRVFYEQLNVPAGCRLLDVACGSGQVALRAARAGVNVTGVDIEPHLVERTQAHAKTQGLHARFIVGDAEELPLEDSSFDFVTSMFGAMFAPRPELVAQELLRVCAPGGVIAMANWTAEGFVGQMFEIIARYIDPVAMGTSSPLLWGNDAVVRERLGPGVAAMMTRRCLYCFSYPFTPAGVADFFRQNYEPINRAFSSLDENAGRKLREELEGLWYVNNRGGDDFTVVQAEYLEVIAVRS